MIKMNIGCGRRNFGPDWIHVDKADYPHIDYNGVYLGPYRRNSVDLIYASHLIAYFDRQEIVPIFQSWFDVLCPGGTLRIATPDFRALTEVYANGYDLASILGPLYGRMEMNGELIYHKTVWDSQDLHRVLYDVGFTNFRHYDHRMTDHPNTGNREDRYDDHSAAYIGDTLISLNIECQKPEE